MQIVLQYFDLVAYMQSVLGSLPEREGGAGVLPYMGYVSMCGSKGKGFSAVLVINRILILAILVLNRVWF